MAPSVLAISVSERSSTSIRSRSRRKKETASRTWRYGVEVSPRPPRQRAFQALESQVSRKK